MDPNAAVTIDDRTPNGYLDDFQLYDRVLSESEILFLYQSPGSTTDNLLVGPIEFCAGRPGGVRLSGRASFPEPAPLPASPPIPRQRPGITTVTITGNES